MTSLEQQLADRFARTGRCLTAHELAQALADEELEESWLGDQADDDAEGRPARA